MLFFIDDEVNEMIGEADLDGDGKCLRFLIYS